MNLCGLQKALEFRLEMSRFKSWSIFVFCSGVLVALDLWLKHWAAVNLQNQPPRSLIPGFIGLTYIENPGAAFGLFAGFAWGRYVLSVASFFFMIGILWYFNRIPKEKRFWFIRVPLILIFAGGMGNLFDRLAFGAVRDMLRFLFINFPIFNLADVYVTVGAFGFMFVTLFIVKDAPLFS